MTAHPKIVPFLSDVNSPDLKHALVVLGPQEHNGQRFEAVNVHDGLPCRVIPIFANGPQTGQFNAGVVRVVVSGTPHPPRVRKPE